MCAAMRILLIVLMAVSTGLLHGQTPRRELDQVRINYLAEQAAAESRVQKYLIRNKGSRLATTASGTVVWLHDVSPSGVPIYITSDNAGLATSLGVNELRAGGSLGISLEGANVLLGIWDSGKIRNDHVELAGKVTQIDDAATFDTHATHVLGTIMATGINPAAGGMAPKATAVAHDFFNDVAEMTLQAKPDQSTILLSNHSYGTLSGWSNDTGSWVWHGDASISNVIDWKFGFYNSTSRFYDQIAFSAPYYLIVKSAGNDNTDVGDGSRPPDCNPFDCIPTNGVAKNIMTVGAVKKLAAPYSGPADVELTSFTSFGPADDGRIKPDIVAPGQAVLSSTAVGTSTYGQLSGTSMSSPATTGTLALWQELFKNLDGENYMKAATLKALALHTSREAGSDPGPDYRFGWGLLDAEGGAKILLGKDNQNIFVEEQTLNNGEVFEMVLMPKQDTKITATIVWTDPAAISPTPSLNPTTKMLVNDLDLRLVDDGGTTQFPWILNPAAPALPATRGDNNLDNVEKIEFENPEPRNYTLRVSHKGTLAGAKQDFSLILSYTSLIDPRITYYWIGNSGEWNDGSNWSLASGGVPANGVPGEEDNVVFDENSFSSANQTVSLSQDQACYSLRWFAKVSTNWSFNAHTLHIKDGINLLSDNINTLSVGTIQLEGTPATDALVNLGSNVLGDLFLNFAGNGARWNLAGDFTANGLQLAEGTVMANGLKLKMNTLQATGVLPKLLNITNGEISGANTLSMNIASASLESENAIIRVLPSIVPYTLNFGANDFNGSISLQTGEASLTGQGLIHQVSGLGTLHLTGSHRFDDFSLMAGAVLEIQENTTQVFDSLFSLTATAGNRIAVRSSGALPGTLFFTQHNKICLDNLDIENVDVSGESVVNAGINSSVINANNWLQAACDEILFADFSVQYDCEGASVFFTNQSTGPFTSLSWNFDDPSSGKDGSVLSNPIHFYEQPGTYTISLQINDGTNTATYNKDITLKPNVLPENKIELDNGKLISFLPANQYQWTLDEVLVENGTERSIDFDDSTGEYAVLIFDEVCNKRSSVFLVTGINDEANPLGILIYPNPATSNIFVGSSGDSQILLIRLIDGLGKPVMVEELADGRLNTEFLLEGLNAGLYILQVETNKGTFAFRLVVR